MLGCAHSARRFPRSMNSARRLLVVLGLTCVVRLAAQPSGATTAAPRPSDPPTTFVSSIDQPSSGFWLEHWFVRTLEEGNPPVTARFRVNDAFVAFHRAYKDRREVRSNGMMQIPVRVDVTSVRAAELYLEMWGGHAGTANKRVTVNGRTTYPIPENGAAQHQCTHQYPSLPLTITDVLRGHNVFQFACDRGSSFWGHYIVDEACLRFELPPGHAALAEASLAGFTARIVAEGRGETIALSLESSGVAAAGGGGIASVEYYGCYAGYDESGFGPGRQWHGFTKKREPLGHIGTVTEPPYRINWDVSMLPAQRDVAVRALVRFKGAPALVYRPPVFEGLEIAARLGVEVGVFNLAELPPRFWSRANRPKSAQIVLPMDAGRIERAELHALAWTGGPGEVREYFKLNGRHFPVADGHDHRTHYTVLPVEPSLLRKGENGIEVLSDTKEHGIELLSPGPALVVRYRR